MKPKTLDKQRIEFNVVGEDFCINGIKVIPYPWYSFPDNLCPICKNGPFQISHNKSSRCDECHTRFRLYGAVLLYGPPDKNKDDFFDAFTKWAEIAIAKGIHLGTKL